MFSNAQLFSQKNLESFLFQFSFSINNIIFDMVKFN